MVKNVQQITRRKNAQYVHEEAVPRKELNYSPGVKANLTKSYDCKHRCKHLVFG